MKRLVVPKFESEAEEAQWWYDNRDVLEQNSIEAMRTGNYHRGGPAAILRETTVINLRVAKTDLARVQKVAEARGISDHTCINQLLREALDREERKKRRKAG